MIVVVLLIVSWVYILFGIIGIFKSSQLYPRLLSSSTIDTVALLTILIALIIASSDYKFILRLFLISVFILLTAPISSHVIIRSAYKNGVSEKVGDTDE